MTEDEMNAAIDAKLEAELQARRARMRNDLVVRLRREAALAHLDRVNARPSRLIRRERGPVSQAPTPNLAPDDSGQVRE